MSATQTDLQALLSYLKKRNLVKASADLEARIALAHRSIISIMIWNEQLGSLPNRSKFFLRELKSDAILSLPLAIMGYKKAAMFSLRCLIEDSIRLIYYADHEIEYRLLNHKEKGEMTIDEYFLYITRHPLISDHVERLDLIGKLKPLYAATSSYVHAATRTRMQLSSALQTIRFDEDFFTEYGNYLKRITASVCTILSLFYHQKFRSFDPALRKLIGKSMGKQTMNYIMRIEPIE